jgi:hypothetical protein
LRHLHAMEEGRKEWFADGGVAVFGIAEVTCRSAARSAGRSRSRSTRRGSSG